MKRFRFHGLGIHELHDLAPWDHSWDAMDPELVTYSHDGTGWPDISGPAERVLSVPDRSGARDLLGDPTNVYKDISNTIGGHGTGPVPGCLWLPEEPIFGGRAAWYSDIIEESAGFFDNFHSILTPNLSIDDADNFDYPQPWWQMILVAPGGLSGNENVLMDGNPGGTTMSAEPTIIAQTWNNFAVVGGDINTGITPTAGKPVLVIWKVDGGSSWVDVTRFTGGSLVTARTNGTNGGAATGLTTQHTGWSHSHYMTAWAIGQGTPDEADVSRVREWGSRILVESG